MCGTTGGGVAAAVGNGPPAPVSDDGGSKVDDVMGVGEDPVGEDGSGKVTVQSGWVMEDCLHHMETFSILNAGPLLEEARRGAKARRPGQRGAKARRPGQRGAKARRPGQRGAKARRPGQRGAKARRPGQRGAKARRPGQRGAKARRPGQRGRQGAGGRGSAAPRQRIQRNRRKGMHYKLWTAAAENYAGRMTEVAVLGEPAESACGGGGAAA
eukprot:jgi/Tetstr1/462845/TSEL_000707.t1